MAEASMVELTPEIRKQLEKFRDEHEGDPVGNVAQRVLFEDDKVRIWDMRLEPGEGSDLHLHEHDYYLAMLEGDMIGGVSPKETGLEPFAAKLPPGGVTVSIPKGSLEWSVNVGRETFYEIVIEPQATSNRFKAGHRIRIDVSSSNFPHFDVNPNTGGPLGTDRRIEIAHNSVFHDAARPSHVVLPVIP